MVSVSDMRVFARSQACGVHGFELPDALAWGIQFHAEMAVEEVTQIAQYRQLKHPELNFDAAKLIAGFRDCRPIATTIFDNFFRMARATGEAQH